jgi:hypothetical protein
MANLDFKKVIDSIQKGFGEEATEIYLPTKAALFLRDNELLEFLKNMDNHTRPEFFEATYYFEQYMTAINPCRNVNGVGGIWTNFILVILFGLMERVMQPKHIDCYNYIQKNANKCIDKNATNKILEEWRKEYGANSKVHNFFELYISEYEKKEIIETISQNPNFENITNTDNPIKKFINWVIECRGKFVHELGIKGMSAFGYEMIMEFNNDGEEIKREWYPTTDIDQLTQYVLLGVFRKYDLRKVLTTIGHN